MSIEKITAEEIREAGVSALPASPSAPSLYGGNALSAAELRAAFDRLPKLIADKFNALVDSFGLENENAGTLASLVATGIADGHSLEQLFRDIENGNFASYLQTADGHTLEEKCSTIYDILQDVALHPGKITGWNGNVTSEVFNATYGAECNTATGKGAHAEGYRNEAAGDASHVGGRDSEDGGYASVFAHGTGLCAARTGQALFGQYNEETPTAALVIGNGTGDSDRRNLFEVTSDGKLKLNGTAVTTVEEHNENASAHADIRNAVVTSVEEHNRNASAHADIRSAVDDARALAEGRARATVFNDFPELFAAFADADGDYNTKAKVMASFRVGDPVYLRDTEVPDLWVSGFTDEPVFGTEAEDDPFGTDRDEVTAGHVRFSRLESGKVDLSGYYTKGQTDSLLAAKADAADVYDKETADTLLAAKADTSSVTSALAAKADDSAVVKHTAQTLTEAQKTQARRNVNAAATDGEYEGMTVGNAEQLVATVGVTDKVPYLFRTAGGSADIGNRESDKIVGGTVCWNQFAKVTRQSDIGAVEFNKIDDYSFTLNGTASAASTTIIGENLGLMLNHIYYVRGDKSNAPGASISLYGGATLTDGGRIFKARSSEESNPNLYLRITDGAIFDHVTFKPEIFDLTKMFGSAIANYVYGLAETAGTWFKDLFPKPYYEYNAGELMSVCTNEHITVGFNAYDHERGEARLLGGKQYQITGAYTGLTYSTGETLTPDENGVFAPTENGELTVAGGDGTTCVHLVWSGYRNGEYEAYVEHRYPLSPIELRGIPKLDANNNLYFDGDTYEKDGTVTRKYGIVDLGTLDWMREYFSSEQKYHFYSSIFTPNAKKPSWVEVAIIKCTSYDTTSKRNVYFGTKGVSMDDTDSRVQLYDPEFENYTGTQVKAALSGVYLVYELATPTTETANPFSDPQIVDDFGTEEYADALATAEINPRDVAIPVGHETFYQANLRDKLQHLPGVPGENGDYFVRASEGTCAMIPLSSVTGRIAALERATKTELPTADGNYVLRCTVQNGSPTFAWEAEQGG